MKGTITIATQVVKMSKYLGISITNASTVSVLQRSFLTDRSLSHQLILGMTRVVTHNQNIEWPRNTSRLVWK